MEYIETLPYDKTDPMAIYEYALPHIDYRLRGIIINVLSSTIRQREYPRTHFL